jgi:acyl-homoserine lactone acylase PvdQ
MRLALALVPLLLCSCMATRAAVENAQAATAQLYAVMDDQQATVGDLAEASEEQANALAALGEAMAEDVANVVALSKTTNWGELLGTAAGSIALAYFGVNKARDSKRVKRGEPTT